MDADTGHLFDGAGGEQAVGGTADDVLRARVHQQLHGLQGRVHRVDDVVHCDAHHAWGRDEAHCQGRITREEGGGEGGFWNQKFVSHKWPPDFPIVNSIAFGKAPR